MPTIEAILVQLKLNNEIESGGAFYWTKCRYHGRVRSRLFVCFYVQVKNNVEDAPWRLLTPQVSCTPRPSSFTSKNAYPAHDSAPARPAVVFNSGEHELVCQNQCTLSTVSNISECYSRLSHHTTTQCSIQSCSFCMRLQDVTLNE
jgi:hypothetical protein